MYTSEIKLDVRYYECDQMGIVHHSNYVRFFECGRNQMMKELGIPIEKMEEDGTSVPRSRIVAERREHNVPGGKRRDSFQAPVQDGGYS